MRHGMISLCALGLMIAAGSTAAAQTVRYVAENGVTYRETQQIIRRPVTETTTQQREQTTYREQVTTETQQQQQLVHTPVTVYQWEPVVHNRWNPLAPEYVTWEWRGRTVWQSEARTVETPVTRREWIPETKTVEVPVTTTRYVDEVQVSRVAVGPTTTSAPLVFVPAGAPATPPAVVADREAVGGIQNLDADRLTR